MSKKPRIPRFQFCTSANKRILVPLELFQQEAQNHACQFIDCFVAYPKEAYKCVSTFTIRDLWLAQKNDMGVEVNFEYNFKNPNLMFRIEAKDTTLTTLSQREWCGKCDIAQNIAHVVNELATSSELRRMIAQC